MKFFLSLVFACVISVSAYAHHNQVQNFQNNGYNYNVQRVFAVRMPFVTTVQVNPYTGYGVSGFNYNQVQNFNGYGVQQIQVIRQQQPVKVHVPVQQQQEVIILKDQPTIIREREVIRNRMGLIGRILGDTRTIERTIQR